jgi:CRISPR/Cas system endoribonuclease Cas6 (RAMP superfamily)
MNKLELDILTSTFYRLSPIIITEIQKTEQLILLNEITARLEDCVFIDEVQSPKKLYQIFLENNPKTIIFQKEDVLQKRKNYIDILEGAFCSSPDSGDLWQVNYDGEKSFKFKGRIIICTVLTKEEIKKSDKLKYIARDGLIL